MKRDTIFSSYRRIIEQAHKTSGRVFALTEQWNALEDPDTGGDLNVIALLHPADSTLRRMLDDGGSLQGVADLQDVERPVRC